jgi:Zn-dependent alcohol dehydrogenase
LWLGFGPGYLQSGTFGFDGWVAATWRFCAFAACLCLGAHIPRYANLYKKGKLMLDQLITDRFCLDDINTAIKRMKTGQTSGRCLISLHDA